MRGRELLQPGCLSWDTDFSLPWDLNWTHSSFWVLSLLAFRLRALGLRLADSPTDLRACHSSWPCEPVPCKKSLHVYIHTHPTGSVSLENSSTGNLHLDWDGCWEDSSHCVPTSLNLCSLVTWIVGDYCAVCPGSHCVPSVWDDKSCAPPVARGWQINTSIITIITPQAPLQEHLTVSLPSMEPKDDESASKTPSVTAERERKE